MNAPSTFAVGVGFCGHTPEWGNLLPSAASQVPALLKSGCNRISMPVTPGANMVAFAADVAYVIAQGVSVLVIPHYDGCNKPGWPYVDPNGFGTWVTGLAVALKASDGPMLSFEIVNEPALVKTALGVQLGWPDLAQFWQNALRSTISAVRNSLPRSRIICPLPEDQGVNAAGNIDTYGYPVTTATLKSMPGVDAWGVHLYNDHGSTSFPFLPFTSSCTVPMAVQIGEAGYRDGTMRAWGVVDQIRQATGKPVVCTECGFFGTGAAQWYQRQAEMLSDLGLEFFFWQWAGGSFELRNHPEALGPAVSAQSSGTAT